MTDKYIFPFAFSNGLKFEGAHCFSNNKVSLLINRLGYIILLDEELLNQIMRMDISDDLCLKLIQRRFVVLRDNEDSEPIVADIKPTLFMIDLTDKCNMSCLYCLRNCNDIVSERVISEKKASEICKYIIDYCHKNQINSILVQPWGGEPLLEKDKIFFIQDYLKQSGINVSMTIETNGTLLNDNLIKELWDRQIYVSVSIDGYEALHDSQRVFVNGKHTHGIVVNSIRMLQKYYGDNVSVISTVTRNSIQHIKQLVEFFAVDLKLNKIKINFVHKSNFSDNNDLCLTSREISECSRVIFNEIIDLHKKGIHIFEYNICTKLKNLLLRNKSDVCCSRGCTGGKNMITFDYDGNLYPCDVTDYPQARLGNINDGNMEDIIKQSLNNSYFTEKHSTNCDSCPWFFYCRGGCTVHTMCNGKQPGEIDDIECSINKELYPLLVDLVLSEPALINELLYSEEDGGIYVE